jgi:hypothetical protein
MTKNELVSTEQRLGLLACVLVVVLAVSPAWANAGTAMVWVVVGHVLFLNLLIGVVEAIGIGLFGASWKRVAIMIPANYVSAIAGIYLLGWILPLIPDPYLQGDSLLRNVDRYSIGMLIALTTIGALIELLFVALAFRKPRSWARLILACAVVNVVTGIGVGVWYHGASDQSLTDSFRLVPAEELATEYSGPDLWVYVINDGNKSIDRVSLNGDREQVAELPIIPNDSHARYIGYRLGFSDQTGNSIPDLVIAGDQRHRWRDEELQAHPVAGWNWDENDTEYYVLVADLRARGAEHRPIRDPETEEIDLRAEDLREEDHRQTVVYENIFDVREAMQVEYPDGRIESFGFVNAAIGTSATPRTITVLPGDLVVFMLSHTEGATSRGVYLASLRTRKIASLGSGRSPLVLIEEPD